MRWSLDKFVAFQTAVESDADVEELRSKLEPLKDDLSELVAVPPRNDASRSLLSKRVLEIEGEQYSLNQQFLDTAAQVSEELQIDEVAAAHLVFWSADDAKRLAVTGLEAAVALFFVRRQYIIDTLRFLLALDDLRDIAKNCLGPDPVGQVSGALRAVEQAIEDLSEKAKRSVLTGVDRSALIALEKDFLLREHALLGTVFYGVVVADWATLDTIVPVLDHAASFERYTTQMISYFPALARFLFGHSEALPTMTNETLRSKWKLSWWRAALEVVHLSGVSASDELYGKCLPAVRRAIDEGGLEFLLALIEDAGNQSSGITDKYDYLVRSRVPQLDGSIYFMLVKHIFEISVLTTQAFVENLADILKEMRLNEEDTYLALSSEQPPDEGPGEDLERFFLLVAAIFRVYKTDQWWKDGSSLLGFLAWGAECQATFMAATFAEMLSSFAGPEADAFLNSEPPQKTWVLSWQSMHDVFVYYLQKLSSESGNLDDDTLLVLSAYLGLLTEVAKKTENPALSTKFAPVLWKLLQSKTLLTSAVLSALAALKPTDWAALDKWAFGEELSLPLRPRFTEMLSTVEEVTSFVELVQVLANTCSGPHLNEYVTFIQKEILPYAPTTELTLLCVSLIRAHLDDLPHVADDCCERPVAQVFFGVLATDVDRLSELTDSHPAVQLVTATVKLLSALLEPRNGKPSRYDELVLYNLQVVPYLALYVSTQHETLALASTKLLGQLQRSPLFRATVTRQSRILSILSSVTEAGRIRFDWIQQLKDRYSKVRVAILEFLVEDLESCVGRSEPLTTAHHLLGFCVNRDSLALDESVGGAATGSSLLTAVCELLQVSLGEMSADLVPAEAAVTARLTTRVLALLVQDRASQTLVLDMLRKSDFLLQVLAYEPVVSPETDSDDLASFFTHRADLLIILSIEVHVCAQQTHLSAEQAYMKALMDLRRRSILSYLDFMKFKTLSSTQLSCLRAWCQLVPVLVGQTTSSTFVLETIQTLTPKLVEYAIADVAFARPLAGLIVLLLEHYKGPSDRLHSLFKAALLSIQPAAYVPQLRRDLYVICYQILRSSGDTEKLRAIHYQGDRLIQTVCGDALFEGEDGSLRLVSLIFLQTLAAMAEHEGEDFVFTALVRYNLLRLLVESLSGLNMNVAYDCSVAKVTLSLLMVVAHTRAGALFLVDSGIFSVLDHLADKNDVLLLVTQLVTAVVVAMGPENGETLTQAQALLGRHSQRIITVLKADAAAHSLAESHVSQLARNLTVLISVSNYVPKAYV